MSAQLHGDLSELEKPQTDLNVSLIFGIFGAGKKGIISYLIIVDNKLDFVGFH
jgi:hypothetical protein